MSKVSRHSSLSPLQIAMVEGNENSFFSLLSEVTSGFNLAGGSGDGFLHLATEGQNPLIIMGVLNIIRNIPLSGSNTHGLINLTNFDRQTALHKIAFSKPDNPNIAQMLVMFGVGYGLLDSSARTASELAERSKNKECARVIKDAENSRRSPEPYVSNNVDMLSYFIDVYDSVISEDDSEMKMNKLEIARQLISIGARSVNETFDSIVEQSSKNNISRKFLDLTYRKLLMIAEKSPDSEEKYRPVISALIDVNSKIVRSGADATISINGFSAESFARKAEDNSLMFDMALELENQRMAAIELSARQSQERWQNYINNLSARTKNNFVEEFAASGNNVSIRDKDGSSLLHCVIKKCSPREINMVLDCPNLDFSTVTEELRGAIETKNSTPVQNILTNPTVISRMSVLQDAVEFRSFVSDLRRLKNANNFRSNLATFENAVNQQRKASQEILKEEEKEAPMAEVSSGLSRKKFKELKKEQRRESEEKKRKAQEERQMEWRAINENSDLLIDDVVLEILDEAVSESLDLEIFEEFFQKTVADIAQESISELQDEIAQVQDFLREYREIRSSDDLPTFVRKMIDNLFSSEGVKISLKGSSIYQKDRSKRPPTDIDLEVEVDQISALSDGEVVEFVRKNFSLVIDESSIYRGRDQSVFSLNIKDPVRNLDISIYDPEKKPSNFLPWITNREFRVEIDRSGAAIGRYPEHFGERELYVNESTRDLVSRLSLLKLTNVVSDDDLDNHVKDRMVTHPAILFSRECTSNQTKRELDGELIDNRISNFAKSHSFTEEVLVEFKRDLVKVLQTERSDSKKLLKLISFMCDTISTPKETSKSLEGNIQANPLVNVSQKHL